MAASRVLFRSSLPSPGRTGTAVEITRKRAGWRYIDFAVRHVAPRKAWVDHTRGKECCLVLLRGSCQIEYAANRRSDHLVATLGPRQDVFAEYPHAIYLPADTRFRVV
ncbi:MAG: 5-deoxy-glucuronate isomerase, partial [Vicinamibacterales bacterium]